VACFDDGNGPADRAIISIKDALPVASPQLSLQVIKGKIAKNTTDAVDGNARFSPEVVVKGGNGDYLFVVDKSALGAELYTIEMHCETSKGIHTGTSEPSLIQNQ